MAKKKKLKELKLHPITSFIIVTVVIIVLSAILSIFNASTSYDIINTKSNELEEKTVTVKNMLSPKDKQYDEKLVSSNSGEDSFNGVKFVFAKASKNFVSLTTVSTLIITLMGISVAEETGLIKTFMKKRLTKINPKVITFIIILLAVFSSIVNEVGYAVLIPLGALLFMFNGRNPLAGIAAAFAGVAFGYSISFFVGTTDMSLIPYTQSAAKLIDDAFYVKMTSNLFIMIFSSIAIAFVGTIVTEKYVVKKMGRYISKTRDDLDKTKEIEYLDLQYEEQKKLKEEESEKKGVKYATYAGIIVGLIFIYMIIPGLPLSGALLDTEQTAYAYQLFGDNSYLESGFTYMFALFMIITGIAYAIGAKSVKSDAELVQRLRTKLSDLGIILVMVFFASQCIAIFKETNIGIMIVALLANLLKALPLSGILLVIVAMIIIAIANLFVPSTLAKWEIISPVLVPMMMQLNMSPQFAQFIFRAAESMTNGITPLLAYFVVYIGYLNIYNKEEKKVYGIRDGIKIMMPYCIALSLTWIAIVVLWYLIGLPLGPSVFPTL